MQTGAPAGTRVAPVPTIRLRTQRGSSDSGHLAEGRKMMFDIPTGRRRQKSERPLREGARSSGCPARRPWRGDTPLGGGLQSSL